MATFNYVVGRTDAYRSVEHGIDIPSLWTATVIQGLPEGKTMNSGSAATAKEAVRFLIHKMKRAGYSGSLIIVDDVTKQRLLKPQSKPIAPMIPIKKRKAMAMKANGSAVKVTSAKENARKTGVASETIIIECWLDTSRETPKAFKLHHSAYVAKSISSFQQKGKVVYVFDERTQGNIAIRHGSLTLPVWLYDKL